MARAALAFLMLLASCDPGFTLQGDVVDVGGQPITDAQIVFACNGNEMHRVAPDTTGHFRDSWLGAFGDSCSVEVRRNGAKPISFNVMASCTHPYTRDTCTEVTVHAVLP